MASFLGGSAFAMARDIAEGYHVVTERTFKGFARPELDKIAFEMDKALREIRGEQPPLDDLAAVQARNRKISRLNSAMMILRTYRQKSKS
jgi:hypothetical protein